MELTQLNKYKNKIFNIAVVMAAVMIAFNFIYKKQFKQIKLLKEKKDIEIEKNHLLESISQVEKRINDYKNLLTKKDASLVINAITDIAKESGAKIISIRPGQERRYSGYIKFPFDLVISINSYHRLGRFISELENYQDVYVVDAMGITSLTQTGELTANLKISSIVSTD